METLLAILATIAVAYALLVLWLWWGR